MGQQVHDPVTNCLSSFLQDQLGVTSDVGSRPCPPPMYLSPERAQRGGGGSEKGGAERGEEKPRPRKGIEGQGLRSGKVLREEGVQGEEESGGGCPPLLADTPAAPTQLLIRAPVITRTWVAATTQRPHRCPGLLPPLLRGQ